MMLFSRACGSVSAFSFAILFTASITGCAASAQFHSRTGASYDAVARQAIVVSEQEADVVARAGGQPIGSISAKGMALNATDDDVTEKAAAVAAKKGGTHIVLTARGEETFQTVHPATRERECAWVEGAEDCTMTYRPATVTERSEPTAKFIVFRVPSDRWAALPQSLRPVPVD